MRRKILGGNALKNCETVRLPASKYFEVERDVRQKLCTEFNTVNVESVLAYRNKPDYGDLDVMLRSDNLPTDLCDRLKRLFNSKEIVPNGNVISLEYQNFQVDVMLTPLSQMKFSRHYFAYNDLGNLMGRVTHKFGLKYGHDGLWYMFRDGDYLVDELNITMNPEEVFKVFDFKYYDWTNGFDNLVDIFEFVARSKYFNPDIYSFDQMNHRSRVRDAKRKTYNSFLDWIEENRNTTWKDRKFFEYGEKTDYLSFLFESFPGFEEKWMKTYYKMLDDRNLKSKFNGTMISELTGLEGKELGEFIRHLKLFFGTNDEFRKYVRLSSEKSLTNFIKNSFEQFKLIERK